MFLPKEFHVNNWTISNRLSSIRNIKSPLGNCMVQFQIFVWDFLLPWKFEEMDESIYQDKIEYNYQYRKFYRGLFRARFEII